MTVDERLAQLGLSLPAPGAAAGSYCTAVRTGDYVSLSGTGSPAVEGIPRTGRIGRDIPVEQGYELARGAALQLLATLRDHLGALDRVRRCVRMTVFVNCDSGFTRHPEVADGATDLLTEVFGDEGRPARAAVGVGSLPFGIPVEIDLTVYVPEV